MTTRVCPILNAFFVKISAVTVLQNLLKCPVGLPWWSNPRTIARQVVFPPVWQPASALVCPQRCHQCNKYGQRLFVRPNSQLFCHSCNGNIHENVVHVSTIVTRLQYAGRNRLSKFSLQFKTI